MKRLIALLVALTLALCAGCAQQPTEAQIAATTLPVYEFTARLCRGTELTVTRLISENVSCLHDYSLNVRQVAAAESAQVIVTSGAGLEDFMSDILENAEALIDSSRGVTVLACAQTHEHSHDHHHEDDAHIWMSPVNAKIMAQNIASGLSDKYPQYSAIFAENLTGVLADLDKLQQYGNEQLANLSARELVTFHDGFAYFAESFGLTILAAVEEESGSEASAAELIHLTQMVREHQLPAVFTEVNGSTAAANIIAAETGAKVYALDMVMSGESYFTAMYRNIDTIKEALG